MSERTAQCEECTNVFECSPTGRLPKLCPSCREGAAEREGGNGKKKRGRSAKPSKAKRSKAAAPSGAIAGAITALQEEIAGLESSLEQRREALNALEAIGA